MILSGLGKTRLCGLKIGNNTGNGFINVTDAI